MVDSVVGYTYAARVALAFGNLGKPDRLTEAEHDVKEDNQQHGDGVDGIARRTHPKRSLGNILPAREEMRPDGESVGHGCEDDEGAHQVGEGGFAAQLDGAETGAQGSCEDGGGDGAAELLVDLREEAGEGRCVVAG